ncbi:MAG: lipoyl synthase [gamma proteobacterium symbiont of Bathyaustriella thionipta]|nr:lipoyl synthase [gamma proteobacterium symbiont of Bathyaustriella thionipta]
MPESSDYQAPSRTQTDSHARGHDKLKRIPVKVDTSIASPRKPKWIRIKAPLGQSVSHIKKILREHKLSSVCEEAACPNLGECFSQGTVTFMIMGDICTRRCPFCDVAHGKPQPLAAEEPAELASAIALMKLKYVVITSVDRDDLREGGAKHFAACIQAIRTESPATRIEILVPDFRGRLDKALAALAQAPPDVFNHNLETVPRLYREARPGSDYQWSLNVLQAFARQHPHIPTKSGIMLGLGETTEEVLQVIQDLYAHGCRMLTLGQYLQPSADHLPVRRYVEPAEFDELKRQAEKIGFASVASGPLVRSSYHADKQAAQITT